MTPSQKRTSESALEELWSDPAVKVIKPRGTLGRASLLGKTTFTSVKEIVYANAEAFISHFRNHKSFLVQDDSSLSAYTFVKTKNNF
ncbi:uncharacterized protein N7479_006527 [Penicillium vulpinum]|uniref:uncharacterized protein n=1 Tax=Penicillium vulpinum TaxID=29845 RepID=UPI002548B641|nr:uncharacterized protein N7479_006527 [Penicillium vulpinum]KAJ5959377.1 hypothetical protein N7479_006527 [Penicillium vulpinum]